jgi:hypothetical protein
MMDVLKTNATLVDHKGNPYSEAESEFWNTGQLRDHFFNEIVPSSPNLCSYYSQRPSTLTNTYSQDWKSNPPKNVMFGTSPVDQKTANGLIVQLSKSMVKDSFLLNLS